MLKPARAKADDPPRPPRPVDSHAVCKGLSRAAIRSSRFAVRHVRTREPARRDPAISVSLEFLMVKLLRAYGECLGARSL